MSLNRPTRFYLWKFSMNLKMSNKFTTNHISLPYNWIDSSSINALCPENRLLSVFIPKNQINKSCKCNQNVRMNNQKCTHNFFIFSMHNEWIHLRNDKVNKESWCTHRKIIELNEETQSTQTHSCGFSCYQVRIQSVSGHRKVLQSFYVTLVFGTRKSNLICGYAYGKSHLCFIMSKVYTDRENVLLIFRGFCWVWNSSPVRRK